MIESPIEPTEDAWCCVTLEGRRWRTAWLMGRKEVPFGEPYPNVREACAASRRINQERYGEWK